MIIIVDVLMDGLDVTVRRGSPCVKPDLASTVPDVQSKSIHLDASAFLYVCLRPDYHYYSVTIVIIIKADDRRTIKSADFIVCLSSA